MKRIIVSAESNMGYVRKNNEDMLWTGNRKLRDGDSYEVLDVEDNASVVFAVADGMGGYECGEIASEMVIDSLSYYVKDLPVGMDEMEFRNSLSDWLASECRLINAAGKVNPSMSSMGTTLVALIEYGESLYTVNCGDSRLYIMRNGELTQLTNDHTPEMQFGHAHRSHSVTNCIGGGCKSSYLEIENISDVVKPDDLFLLCSDGLTDMMSDVTIASVLRLNEGVVNASPLINAALNAGGGDNVSVCLVKFETIND